MDAMKLKLLEEILSHLSDSQGSDLKSLLDESKAPPMVEEADPLSGDKPDGLKVKSVEVMGDPLAEKEPGDEMALDEASGGNEMSDEELEELVSKYLK